MDTTQMTYEQCCNYFQGKFVAWNTVLPDKNVRKYIVASGKANLANEFRTDNYFKQVVCPYLAQYAIGKEKEAAATIIQDASSLFSGNFLPVELEILVGAILEACGYETVGSQLIKLATITILAAAGLAFISYLLGEQ
jgi:hypothetical protein